MDWITVERDLMESQQQIASEKERPARRGTEEEFRPLPAIDEDWMEATEARLDELFG